MQGVYSPRAATGNAQPTITDAASFMFSDLASGVSLEKRLELVRSIASNFGERTYDALEKKLSEKIFAIFASDSDLRVRQALAENLKGHPEMPHSIALKLAQDVIEVAEPVLRFSTVLTDKDLVHLIQHSGSLAHRVAIAMREVVSQEVCQTLIDTGETDVVKTLVANKGAELTETLLGQVIDQFSGRQDVMEAMSGRQGMPITIVTRMMEVVSKDLQVKLAGEYNISTDAARAVMRHTQENATLGLIGLRAPDADVEKIVKQLFAANQLTPSLVLKALCTGDMPFFEAALAKLGGVSFKNARTLLRTKGAVGFKSLYTAARLPSSVFDAVQVIVSFAIQDVAANDDVDGAAYASRMIERIIDGGYDQKVDNMSYLVGLMSSQLGTSTNRTAH